MLVYMARQVPARKLTGESLRVQGWDLVLTGHSLGAGAAALIALKLRSRFPGARARLGTSYDCKLQTGDSKLASRHLCMWPLGAPQELRNDRLHGSFLLLRACKEERVHMGLTGVGAGAVQTCAAGRSARRAA